MHNVLNRLALIVTLLAGIAVLGACDNTIRGMGEDIEDSGDAIEDSSQ